MNHDHLIKLVSEANNNLLAEVDHRKLSEDLIDIINNELGHIIEALNADYTSKGATVEKPVITGINPFSSITSLTVSPELLQRIRDTRKKNSFTEEIVALWAYNNIKGKSTIQYSINEAESGAHVEWAGKIVLFNTGYIQRIEELLTYNVKNPQRFFKFVGCSDIIPFQLLDEHALGFLTDDQVKHLIENNLGM